MPRSMTSTGGNSSGLLQMFRPFSVGMSPCEEKHMTATRQDWHCDIMRNLVVTTSEMHIVPFAKQ